MKTQIKFLKETNVLHGFERKILPIKKPTLKIGLKKPTPKQMLKRIPIALAPVKTGNTSKNLLYEIRQIICCLYQEKEIDKKVMNSK